MIELNPIDPIDGLATVEVVKDGVVIGWNQTAE